MSQSGDTRFPPTGEYSIFGLAMTDESKRVRGRRLGFTAILFGSATLIAVLYSVERYAYGLLVGRPMSLAQLVPAELALTYIWVLLTPLVMSSAHRFPLWRAGQGGWESAGRNWLIQVAVAHLFVVLHAALFTGAALLFGYDRQVPAGQLFGAYFLSWFVLDFVVFCLLVAVYHAVVYYHASRDRAVCASELEARLAQTQLQVLRVQLQPHFLFNTLHSIAALMHRDVERADSMIAALSDMLRMSLRNAGNQEVRVQEEIDILRRYLDVMLLRFADRLRVDIRVAPEVREARLPSLVLQPLVENAIRHGLADAVIGGEVIVSIDRHGQMLRCRVKDNGRGLPANGFREGIGMANTRARLKQLYGAHHQFELRNDPRGGACAVLAVPFRLLDAVAAD
jgi:two-component system LytT family sensor kinase